MSVLIYLSSIFQTPVFPNDGIKNTIKLMSVVISYTVMESLEPLWWRQQAHPQHWQDYTSLHGLLFRKTCIVINIAVISLNLTNVYSNKAKRKSNTHRHKQLDHRHSCMEFSKAPCQFKMVFIQCTLLCSSAYINNCCLTTSNIEADCHVEPASSALTHRPCSVKRG